ncbi:ferrochelatase [Thermoplasma sp.]|uniref:ferrochelatase n=1 Tax=Thermoplasma sp. TaxID=1973142 RepID=UPI002620247F|nr:ferrochelatase [Thermoplasma sp.]
MKSALLLLSYGSPERIEDVDEYLKNIFNGKQVPEAIREENLKKYEMFGGRSPSNRIIESIGKKLQDRFGGEIDVLLAYKHWNPSIEEIAGNLAGYDNVVAMPLFSFYSESVRDSYLNPLLAAFKRYNISARMEFVNGLANNDLFQPMWANIISECTGSKTFHIFDAHSLPNAQREEDYLFWLRYSTYKISQILGISHSDFGFQGGHEGWLGPSIYSLIDKIEEKNVTVIPISFLYDHLEILYDLDYEFRKALEARGKIYTRVKMPNDSPMMINLIDRVTRSAITHLSGEMINGGTSTRVRAESRT